MVGKKKKIKQTEKTYRYLKEQEKQFCEINLIAIQDKISKRELLLTTTEHLPEHTNYMSRKNFLS